MKNGAIVPYRSLQVGARMMLQWLKSSAGTDGGATSGDGFADSNGRDQARGRRHPGANVGSECVNERNLVERCLAGDRDAQRELYEKTCVRIYRLLLRMTGNADDASDLTQETYVKGLKGLDQFDGRSAVASWFYRIAVNEALQFRRRQGVGTVKLQEIAPIQPTEAARPRTDLRVDLKDALAELPGDDRAVLLLRYQEELDYRAIAGVLDCAEGTVASRLNRARDRLREILRKSYGC